MENRETLTDPHLPQHSDSQTCPFCRSEIKGREAVSIHQFQGRPVEARLPAEDPRPGSDQEDREEPQGQVSGARPRLELDPWV